MGSPGGFDGMKIMRLKSIVKTSASRVNEWEEQIKPVCRSIHEG